VPLYEYRCIACSHAFETLVRRGDVPQCPACQSGELERLTSLFTVDSAGTRQAARAASMPKAVQTHREREVGEVEEYRRHRH
jgi:putative FmdB family regulatory protein